MWYGKKESDLGRLSVVWEEGVWYEKLECGKWYGKVESGMVGGVC